MATNPGQAKKAYSRFSQAVDKYLSLQTEYLGSVWMDESMRNAVSTQRPVALYPKTDPSARCFYRIAESIEDLFERPSTPKLAFSQYWQKVIESQHKGKVFSPAIKPMKLQALQQNNIAEVDDPLTQVQKQLLAKVADAQLEKSQQFSQADSHDQDTHLEDISANEQIRIEPDSYIPYPSANVSIPQKYQEQVRAELSSKKESDSFITVNESDSILSEDSERNWLDLRVRLNQFISDSNTTPEQFLTLFSSAIYSFGDKLGNASVDLLHGLLHALDPEKLSDEQKLLLLSDYERIGLESFKKQQDSRMKKARYDSQGFGDQQALVQAIRSSASDLPLESLLESIKYASLVDSSSK
jgi:hypothetical protein